MSYVRGTSHTSIVQRASRTRGESKGRYGIHSRLIPSLNVPSVVNRLSAEL